MIFKSCSCSHYVLHKKGKGSIVILEDRDGVIYWRNLDCEELKFIGHDATCLYDAKSSKVIANRVEWKVQLHVRDDHPGNVKLQQVKPGAGGSDLATFLPH